MKEIFSAIKKYSFLIFLFAAGRRIQRVCSVWFWTGYTKALLRLLGCSYGKGLKVDGHVWIRVREKGAICLGDYVTINSRFGSNLVGLNTPTVMECLGSGRIEIGSGSGLSGVVISSRSLVRLGSDVKIGGNVRIFDHDYHSLDYRIRRDSCADMLACARSDVIIGNDAFVGANAMILKGVHVGERAIIAAGSILTRSVGADEVWGGNPAGFIKKYITESSR